MTSVVDFVAGTNVYVKAAVFLTDFAVDFAGSLFDENDAIYSISSNVIAKSPSYSITSSLRS